MALTIDNPEVEKLAQELAEQTGASVPDAVAMAIRASLVEKASAAPRTADGTIKDPVVEEIRERMLREPRPDPESTRAAIREIQARIAELPVLDARTPDELLGYDEFGLPH
jgi:antitoxin VapB